MKYFVALFILINSCLHIKAQFHTIASRPLQNKVETVKDRPKSETVGVKDSLAMVGKKEESIDREKWLEWHMSVSLPLKKIKVTSPFGMRKDPFTGERKMHNGIDLYARNDEVYAMFPGVVKKVGYDKRSGNFIILQHGDYSVVYCHLSRKRPYWQVMWLPSRAIRGVVLESIYTLLFVIRGSVLIPN